MSYACKASKKKSNKWMATRFLDIAMADNRLRDKWLPATVYFEALEADKYEDVVGKEAQKTADGFTLSNFKRAVNKEHQDTRSNFDGTHKGVLIHENKALDAKQNFYYYVTKPGKKVAKPKQGSVFQTTQVSQPPNKRKKTINQATTEVAEKMPDEVEEMVVEKASTAEHLRLLRI
ncbi:hypothetical protein FisN_1Hu172 [Fistulifera solaris]|uniref:Uncharacterized protein n=1 Tax=Fistulifera solaris TaxID=1519565 RepID=A0A1Z5JEC5_FISSO|nr:hypothetical protein FisN_1Hu172 [Fistulifera solaris]|eukprot:GAX12242.1 hypothetical protein FisN_1Hu172 [Fistulifera solaris]